MLPALRNHAEHGGGGARVHPTAAVHGRSLVGLEGPCLPLGAERAGDLTAVGGAQADLVGVAPLHASSVDAHHRSWLRVGQVQAAGGGESAQWDSRKRTTSPNGSKGGAENGSAASR